jgi:hypothetical protein
MSQFLYFWRDISDSINVKGYLATPIRDEAVTSKLNARYGCDGNGWYELKATDNRNFEQIFDEYFHNQSALDFAGNSLLDIVDQLSETTNSIVFCYGECDGELMFCGSPYDFRQLILKGLSSYPIELHLALKPID